jgi:phosphoglycerol transferase MdoB-like AlkP superfamily enzyme
MSSNNKRTCYLIDKEFQYYFLLNVLMMLFSTALATFLLAIFICFIGFKGDGDLLFLLVWGGLLISLAVLMGVWAIKFSHRVAGPLYQLRSALKQISDGVQPEPLRFREKDWIKDVQTDFNAALAKIYENTQAENDTVE